MTASSLPPLTDESEPLGPWRDESGRRSVHRSAGSSLVLPECLAGSGASGSIFRKLRPALSSAWPRATAGLSTDFFAAPTVALRLGVIGRPRGPAYPRTSLSRLRRRNRLVCGLDDGRLGHMRRPLPGPRASRSSNLLRCSNALGAAAAGTPGSSISGSPSGFCGSGAGAEASTTGAWKSTCCCGLNQPRKLEAALQELVRGRRRQRERAGVPALELRQPAARSDLRLEHAHVALGETILVSTSSSAARSEATRSETR